jgi:uncharacterized membrane protein YvlD (DUF360 family)
MRTGHLTGLLVHLVFTGVSVGPLALPFKVLTLGLGSWLINGFVFLIAGRLASGVEVSGCLTAVLASIGVTFVNAVLERLLLRR